MSKPDPENTQQKPLPEKLLAWVETSGRALELRVARTYGEQRATRILPSFAYLDPITKTPREGDVHAEFEWTEGAGTSSPLACSLVAVTECKSGRSKPWVAFVADQAEQVDTLSLDDWMVAAWAPYTPVNKRLPGVWIGNAPFDDAGPATHVVAANLGQDHGKNNEKDEAADAVRQVLAAADALRARTHVHDQRRPRGTFIIAVVVTAAPLFTCKLNTAGEVALVKVERFSVWGNLGDRRRRVYVMNESHVAEFARDLHLQVLRASGALPR